MWYESRYTTVDYFHRMFEVVRFMFVSLAILHIGTVDSMSDATRSDTMVFCIAALGEALMHMGQSVEVLLRGQGDREAITNHTKRMLKYMTPTLLLYSAAVAVSISLYVRPEEEHSSSHEEGHSSSHERFLGANPFRDSNKAPVWDWKIEDLPLTLLAVAWLLSIVLTFFFELRATNGKHGDVRTQLVPSNIDYVIHRYGEWCLLMIGEGKGDMCRNCLGACAS